MDDKRKFKRIGVSFIVLYKVDSPLSVRILVGDKEINAIALDLSELGMAILTDYEIPALTRVNVKFRILNEDAIRSENRCRSMDIEGEVRYNLFIEAKKVFRIGIRFIGISADARQFIADFVRVSLFRPTTQG